MAQYLLFKNDRGFNDKYAGFDNQNELLDFLEWDEAPMWRLLRNAVGRSITRVLGFDPYVKIFELVGDAEVMECFWLLSKSDHWGKMVIFKTANISDLDALATHILELRENIVKRDPKTGKLYTSRMSLMFSDGGSTTFAEDYRDVASDFATQVEFIKFCRPDDHYLQLIDEMEMDVA